MRKCKDSASWFDTILGKYQLDCGLQTAAFSRATFVPVIFYLLFQDKFVKGLTAVAVNG